MKKIILALLLMVVVYLVGTRFFTNPTKEQSLAQAWNTNQGAVVQISPLYKRISLSAKNNLVYLVGDFQISSKEDSAISVSLPKLLKDTTTFAAASTSPQFSAIKLKRVHIVGFAAETKASFSTSTIQVKRGTSYYRFVWTIQKNQLPAGSYQATFDTYSIGNSTTTHPFNTSWTKAVLLTPPISTYLDGNNYRLTSINNTSLTGTTTPLLTFEQGQLRVRFCNTFRGTYELKKNKLYAGNLVKIEQKPCDTENFRRAENNFLLQSEFGFSISVDGDMLTLQSNIGENMTFRFIKHTPTNSITRIYPCDFVGPLEVGAIRDCGGLGSVLGVGLPMLTSISTTSTRIGAQVTIGGTNFATSNTIMFANVATGGLIQYTPLLTTATSGTNLLTFTIPANYSCTPSSPDIACTPLPVTNGTYSVKVKTPAGISSGAFTMVIY